jgi:hypothetical protein
MRCFFLLHVAAVVILNSFGSHGSEEAPIRLEEQGSLLPNTNDHPRNENPSRTSAPFLIGTGIYDM